MTNTKRALESMKDMKSNLKDHPVSFTDILPNITGQKNDAVIQFQHNWISDGAFDGAGW
jgi:hypothetical protein